MCALEVSSLWCHKGHWSPSQIWFSCSETAWFLSPSKSVEGTIKFQFEWEAKIVGNGELIGLISCFLESFRLCLEWKVKTFNTYKTQKGGLQRNKLTAKIQWQLTINFQSLTICLDGPQRIIKVGCRYCSTQGWTQERSKYRGKDQDLQHTEMERKTDGWSSAKPRVSLR